MFINTLVTFIPTYAYNARYPTCHLHFVIGVTRLIWHVKLGNKMKKFGNHCLTWKTSFLLALVSAKEVRELHGLSFHVHHLR